eukprot:1470837-Rhodomonas_salina.2
MCGTEIGYGATRGGGGGGAGRGGTRALHAPEIEYKKPQFQYNLYQKGGFLYWNSGCMLAQYRTSHSRIR